MPRRLPERIQREGRKRRKIKGRSHHSLPFQETSVREGGKIKVLMNNIGSRGDGATEIKGFSILPQTKVGKRLKIRMKLKESLSSRKS